MIKINEAKELFKVWAISAVLVVVGFCLAYQYAGPSPTQNIHIATGGQGGAYLQFGHTYSRRFEKDGVELTVLETSGSVDNLSRLSAGDDAAHAALIQGGVGTPEDYPMLESLGSLYYEPLWLFHSKNRILDNLGGMVRWRIALGGQGSGTYALSKRLLAENGITGETARFVTLGGRDGVDALLTGQVDALFMVAGASSAHVRRLLRHPDVELYSFRRADAYVRNFKYLSKVTLPEGSVNLRRNIPAKEVVLLAATANLVVRNDLHPALKYLFLMTAAEVHREGGLLEQRGVFPNPLTVGFPLNKEARQFYKDGPPFLIRMLPFWLATWMVRMFVMIIPLLTILYPLLKIAPPTYHWRVRRKVRKVYKQLHQLEEDVQRTRDSQKLEELQQRLKTLERKAAAVNVPTSQLQSQYMLRRHIELVKHRIKDAKASDNQARSIRAA